MRDVTKTMDTKYSRDDKDSDRCRYRMTHEDRSTEGTSREATKGRQIKCQLIFEEIFKCTGRTIRVPQGIIERKNTVPKYFEHAQKPQQTGQKKTRTKTEGISNERRKPNCIEIKKKGNALEEQ